MTKTLLTLLAVTICFTTLTFSQDKVDIYAGVPFQHVSAGPNYYGWELAGTYNLNSWLGATVDSAGTYNHGQNYFLTFGPTISLPSPTKYISPFIGASLGWDFTQINGSTNAGLGFMTGGGFDVPLTKHVSLRPLNLNYYLFRHQDHNFNSLWYSGGLVVKF